jgi:hypothetical protein
MPRRERRADPAGEGVAVGLYEQVQKAIEKANGIAAKFDRERDTYTPTSKGGLILQRIEEKIEALTPTLAPTVTFTPAGGALKLLVANTGRWRYFTVESANLGSYDFSSGNTKTPFEADLTCEISYPADQTVEVEASGTTTAYAVRDLKAEDDEALDKLLRTDSSIFAVSPAISNVYVKRLAAAFDIGDTIRRHRYQLFFLRSF